MAIPRQLQRTNLKGMADALASQPYLLRLGKLFSETFCSEVDGDEFYLSIFYAGSMI
jgi:hypothetical protein